MAAATATWRPGHMVRALRELQQRIKQVDLVLEVRDARVPFSSANSQLQALVQYKRRIVVLNKADLADPHATQAVCSRMREQGLRVMACTAAQGAAGEVLQEALSWLRHDRPTSDLSLVLVAGVPNVGKSSLINALKLAAMRKGLLEGKQAYNKTARAGPLPGVTQHLGGFKVCVDPRVYVLDMPGVLPLPEVDGGERTLRLALTGAVKEGIVPEGAQMRHLLQLLLQEPRRARQLWCAADGQQAAIGGGIRESGRGGAVAAEAGMAIARALYEAVTLEMREPQGWHPGQEDDAAGDADGQKDVGAPGINRRLAWLLQELAGSAAVDLGRRTALQRRLLAAFRAGQLGRYTLDEV